MLALPTFRLPAGNLDANLTFFSEVLGYSDDEIQQEIQNALQFFSERFALTQPNELGQRFFQNATLQPTRRNPRIKAILNRWILTAELRNKIKAVLDSVRKESPVVRIDMPFDTPQFKSGRKLLCLFILCIHVKHNFSLSSACSNRYVIVQIIKLCIVFNIVLSYYCAIKECYHLWE